MKSQPPTGSVVNKSGRREIYILCNNTIKPKILHLAAYAADNIVSPWRKVEVRMIPAVLTHEWNNDLLHIKTFFRSGVFFRISAEPWEQLRSVGVILSVPVMKMLNILRHGEETEYGGPLVLMAVVCLCNATSNRRHPEAQNDGGEEWQHSKVICSILDIGNSSRGSNLNDS